MNDLFSEDPAGDTSPIVEVTAYESWPCQECGVISPRWLCRYHGPNLAAYCPDCGGRCGTNSTWVSKSKAGLDQRHVCRPFDFSPKVRIQILERDRYRCFGCGLSGDDVVLHVDHVVPGTGSGVDDGVTLCDVCNLGKGNLNLPNFLEEFKARRLS